jgi:subtilisin family serine protease
VLLDMALRPEVGRIVLESRIQLIEPVPDGGLSAMSNAPDVVERGLRDIGVERAWRLGFKGQGIVVAVTDTGANNLHPALAASYRGTGEGHDYNWFDAVDGADKPEDDSGHGTHVAGIMTGKHGARQIGAAPDAKWIACRLIKERSGTDRNALDCLQFMLAPTKLDGTAPRPDLAPDVINASWGNDPSEGCLARLLHDAIRNLDAAGILFVASAGNSGDACQTVCVPGAFPEALTVGNYDVTTRRINASSSRGPVPWPEGDLIKPEISAPGTSINSSVPPAAYEEKTGTSMAAPHIAGVAALVLSARPELRGQPQAVKELLTGSAKGLNPDRCGPSGDRDLNNSAGYGLVQAEDSIVAALSATPRPTVTPTATPTLTVTPTATPTRTATPLATATPNRFPAYMPASLNRPG